MVRINLSEQTVVPEKPQRSLSLYSLANAFVNSQLLQALAYLLCFKQAASFPIKKLCQSPSKRHNAEALLIH